ncbi:MAG: response regulator [Bacteroidetes bacterium]|nr:response regulator [Bacteroidota bacterium]
MSAVNRRTVNPDLHWFRNSPPSQCVEIIVRDNGPGIAPQYIDKIFDPFFSTKKMSDKKGSGLGLTVVYNIVKNHHGAILVKSDEGKGTAFHIFLPAVEYSSEPATGDAVAQYRARNNELVLLVDDDEGMQILGKELLEDNGYRVLVASGGMQAIELLEQHKEEVALVILDLVMPVLDGGQTYLRMKKVKPDLKAFFCSGFVTDSLISNLLAEEHLTAIQKPFKSEQFLKFVHTTLTK